MAVNYAKSDTGLSAPQLAVTSTGVAPSSGAAVAPAATAASTDWLPWVLIGAGVALFAGLLGYWLISRRHAEPVEAAASPASAARPTYAERGAPAGAGPAAAAHRAGPACGNTHFGRRTGRILPQLRKRAQGRRPLLLTVRHIPPLIGVAPMRKLFFVVALLTVFALATTAYSADADPKSDQ